MIKDAWFPIGHRLSENIFLGTVQIDGDDFQIVSRRDHSTYILIVKENLAQSWISGGLLSETDLCSTKFGNNIYYFIVSDIERVLSPISSCETPENLSEIIGFAASVHRTRSKIATGSLIDSIYCEKLSLLLPFSESSDSVPDDVLIGSYATGGIHVSIRSTRRMRSLLPWLDEDDLNQICEAAGIQTIVKTANFSKEDNEGSTQEEFELFGRPSLELFFKEHIIDIIQKPEQYKALGIDFPSAVILHGPPGCGKTYAVEKLVEYIDWPYYSVDSSTIGSPYIHETGKKIAEVFAAATQNAPSVVVIDEMESFLADRESGSGSSTHHVEEVAEFLRRIPEAIKNQVLVIGMTNRIEMIDPAILRRGRFDHVIEVPMATEQEVEALLSKLISERPCAEDLDISKAAKQLAGRPLSDVSFSVREASRLTAKSGKTRIEDELLQHAVTETVSRGKPTTQRKIGF